MALTHNSNEIQRVFANGVEMQRVFINGVQIFGDTIESINPEEGLTLTGNIPEGSQDIDLIDNVPYVFAFNINFPNVSSNGTFYEKGGAGRGMWWGIKGNYFRIRAGEGGSSFSAGSTFPSGVLGVDVPYANIPSSVKGSGNFGRGVIELDPTNGNLTTKFYIDGVLIAESTASSAPASNELEGGAGGMHITGGGVNVSGEPTGNWSGQSDGSGIDYYQDQKIGDTGSGDTGGNEYGLYPVELGYSGGLASSGPAACSFFPGSTTYYIDAPDLTTATIIYRRSNASQQANLSGFVSDGIYSREISSGTFIAPAQNC